LLKLALPALTLVFSAPVAEGNSIRVTESAALSGGYGLLVVMDDARRTPPREAWVAVGPDKGFDNETALGGSFLLDPSEITVGRRSGKSNKNGGQGRGPARICFLSLSRDLDRGGARVILFLEQGPRGLWLLGAELWDDRLGRYVAAGKAPLYGDVEALEGRSSRLDGQTPEATRVWFEWGAASSPVAHDGYFRLFRTDAMDPDGQPMLLIERTNLSNEAQTLNYMQVGVVDVSHQLPRMFGALHLDEFELNREPATINTLDSQN